MTRFDVVVLPEAEAEVREAFHWYFERSAIAADAFRGEVLAAIDRLVTTATMWPEDEQLTDYGPRALDHPVLPAPHQSSADDA